MHLDVRIPIGLMFVIFGAILTAFGVMSGPELYTRSLGININFYWGLVLLVFGVIMLLLAWRGRQKNAGS